MTHIERPNATKKTYLGNAYGYDLYTGIDGTTDVIPPLAPITTSSIEIGDYLEGKGIYLGRWTPKDKDFRFDLGRTFDIYAAPEDLCDKHGNRLVISFNKAVKSVGKLRNWHGHKGVRMADHIAILKAVEAGEYERLQNWFIPTGDIVEYLIHGNRDAGFIKDIKGKYWTSSRCTEDIYDESYAYIRVIDPSADKVPYKDPDLPPPVLGSHQYCGERYPVRPVRAELVAEF